MGNSQRAHTMLIKDSLQVKAVGLLLLLLLLPMLQPFRWQATCTTIQMPVL